MLVQDLGHPDEYGQVTAYIPCPSLVNCYVTLLA